jgi:hypothetical protein
MLGQTMLGGQLRDLRAAWQHLQRREDISQNVFVMGGSGRQPLAADAAFKHPRRVDRPAESQPEGAILSLLFGLFEPKATVIVGRHGLVSYRSILDSPFVQVPHAAIVPGVLQTADLPDLAVVLAPREVVLDVLVDGRGRLLPKRDAEAVYDAAARSNTGEGRPASLQISDSDAPLTDRR